MAPLSHKQIQGLRLAARFGVNGLHPATFKSLMRRGLIAYSGITDEGAARLAEFDQPLTPGPDRT